MSTLTFRPRGKPVFDANVRPATAMMNRRLFATAGLLAELDRHGVARAVVYHAQKPRRSVRSRAINSWKSGWEMTGV